MALIRPDDFPGNSNRSKLSSEEKLEGDKTIKRVVSGKVFKKKKSFLNRMSQTIFNDDAESVMSYVFFDVLVPGAKDVVLEMFKTGLEMWFYGSSKPSGKIRRDGIKSHVSYGAFYDRDERSNSRSLRHRGNHNFDDIIIPDRDEAEEVLETLIDLIDQYEVAKVSDFYELVGITGEFTDEKFGWDDLRKAAVRRVRGGYIVDLPRPIQL